MKELYGTKYRQGEQEYISAIIPMGVILNKYEVLIYNKDPYGFQRVPKKKHYGSIAKELSSNINSQVTPSSVILGVSSDELNEMLLMKTISSNDDTELVKFTVNQEYGTKFRVIDGQHRIKGFEKAREDALKKGNGELIEEIDSYNVNVIIMVSNPMKRKPEVNVFSNINSKAKPLRMDLTILAEHLYDLIEQPDDMNEKKFLAVKVVEHLNNGIYCKYWHNGILMDAYNNEVRVGCVGFKTFYESIIPICENECENEEGLTDAKTYPEKKMILDDLSKQVAQEIGECWNIVFEKWNVEKAEQIFNGEEFVETYYNKDFYLQRTMGALAINKLIVESYKETGGYEDFKDKIMRSSLSIKDWSIGGRFSGMSSLAGVNKIKQIIAE